jgi:hypothetical protein
MNTTKQALKKSTVPGYVVEFGIVDADNGGNVVSKNAIF